jgi:hypothetical protein
MKPFEIYERITAKLAASNLKYERGEFAEACRLYDEAARDFEENGEKIEAESLVRFNILKNIVEKGARLYVSFRNKAQ